MDRERAVLSYFSAVATWLNTRHAWLISKVSYKNMTKPCDRYILVISRNRARQYFYLDIFIYVTDMLQLHGRVSCDECNLREEMLRIRQVWRREEKEQA